MGGADRSSTPRPLVDAETLTTTKWFRPCCLLFAVVHPSSVRRRPKPKPSFQGDDHHMALEKEEAIRGMPSMDLLWLREKQIIQWRTIMLLNLFNTKDVRLDFSLFMMGI